jgi:SAM-dependent methyltransferase
VFGIDPSPEMISAARRGARGSEFHNVEFGVAAAERLPFTPGRFDAVVSRFAIMFSPSPVEAIREILRVTKPGGKLAFAVWASAEKSPFHYVILRVVEPYLNASDTPPDSWDAFRFARLGQLMTILNEAGATETSERLLQFRIEAPVSVEDFWELRTQMSEKLRSKLREVSPDQLAEIKSRAIEELRQYRTDAGMSFPTEVLIVSGKVCDITQE